MLLDHVTQDGHYFEDTKEKKPTGFVYIRRHKKNCSRYD